MKKHISILLAVMLLLQVSPSMCTALSAVPTEAINNDRAVEAPKLSSYGDVNFDDTISVSDARLILRAAVGLESFDSFTAFIADVNFDSVVGIADARFVLRISVGLESPYVDDPYHKCHYEQQKYFCVTCRRIQPNLFAAFVNYWLETYVHTQQDGLYYYAFGEENQVFTIMTNSGSPLQMYMACTYVDENEIAYMTLINISRISGTDAGVFQCYDLQTEKVFAQAEFTYNKTTYERNDALPFDVYEGNYDLQEDFESLAGLQLSAALIAVKQLFESEFYRLTPELMLFPSFVFEN